MDIKNIYRPRATLSEQEAAAKAVEGVLQATEALGPEVAAEVVEAIPIEILPSETTDLEYQR